MASNNNLTFSSSPRRLDSSPLSSARSDISSLSDLNETKLQTSLNPAIHVKSPRSEHEDSVKEQTASFLPSNNPQEPLKEFTKPIIDQITPFPEQTKLPQHTMAPTTRSRTTIPASGSKASTLAPETPKKAATPKLIRLNAGVKKPALAKPPFKTPAKPAVKSGAKPSATKSKVAPKCTKADPFTAATVLSSKKSPLAKDGVDLVAILTHPKAWGSLSKSQIDALCPILPRPLRQRIETDSRTTQISAPDLLSRSAVFKQDCERFGEELTEGYREVTWMEKAGLAMEERARDQMRSGKEGMFEEYWGQGAKK